MINQFQSQNPSRKRSLRSSKFNISNSSPSSRSRSKKSHKTYNHNSAHKLKADSRGTPRRAYQSFNQHRKDDNFEDSKQNNHEDNQSSDKQSKKSSKSTSFQNPDDKRPSQNNNWELKFKNTPESHYGDSNEESQFIDRVQENKKKDIQSSSMDRDKNSERYREEFRTNGRRSPKANNTNYRWKTYLHQGQQK